MKKFASLFLLLLLIVAACNRNDNSVPDSQEEDTADDAPLFNLRTDVLAKESGNWTLLPDTVDLQERQAGLVMTAGYQHTTSPGVGKISMTVFRTVDEARQVFNDQLAQWQSNTSNTVKKITAFADDAYTLNQTQAGMALVEENGFLLVEFDGEITHTDLDLLNLMQVGVDALTFREPRHEERGTLGNATLAPPGSAQ